MQGPSLAQISAFVAVVEQKSFANAAKHLGLSPPRVSELVRNIEQTMGVRLIERTTRSVAVTEAGERLLARLQVILSDYQDALESMNDFRDKPAGVLRLTVAPPAAEFVLAPVIGEFLCLYPDIRLDISVDSMLTDIVERRFDAGIRPGDRLERDMIAVRVSEDIRLVVVAAPSYLARRGLPKTPDAIVNHDWIRIRLPNGTLFPLRFREKRRSFEAHAEAKLAATDGTLLLSAALAGAGLLQVPIGYVSRELAAGRLVTVLEQWAPASAGGFFLYYPSRRQIRPALKAFVDFVREAYRSSAKQSATAKDELAHA